LIWINSVFKIIKVQALMVSEKLICALQKFYARLPGVKRVAAE
tara:strand:+ start:606 stop:734 length:129 start_codon:yes stop_codon:yes gene_type:complete